MGLVTEYDGMQIEGQHTIKTTVERCMGLTSRDMSVLLFFFGTAPYKGTYLDMSEFIASTPQAIGISVNNLIGRKIVVKNSGVYRVNQLKEWV